MTDPIYVKGETGINWGKPIPIVQGRYENIHAAEASLEEMREDPHMQHKAVLLMENKKGKRSHFGHYADEKVIAPFVTHKKSPPNTEGDSL